MCYYLSTPLNNCSINKIKFKKIYQICWMERSYRIEKNSHIASLASVLNGANIIERHFTILDRKKTKDGVVSINPMMPQIF